VLSQITEPSELPVNILDARRHCAITDDTHDVLLNGLLSSATEWVERHLNARIMLQTVRLSLPEFPAYLPIYPVQSVDSVKYDDVDGAEQTVDPSGYSVSLSGIRPVISPTDEWPSLSGKKPNPVRMELTVGFEKAPEPVKTAILVMVQEMFANRGDSITGTMVTPSRFTVARLLSGYRRQVL